MTRPTMPSVRYYFVDEAGDGTLFDAKGRVLIGEQGCSRYFILGLIDLPEASIPLLEGELEALRQNLVADSYFRQVPSMQPQAKKTAVAFHAKDDLPEVRREVFSILRRYKLRFFAVVRNKRNLLEYVLQRNEQDSKYRYHPNELYDSLVRRLFKTLLHQDDTYRITFAKRGAADRTVALREALEAAQRRFAVQWNIESRATLEVLPQIPPAAPGLQVADYFLWALQRLYERREDRYVAYLWDSFRLVHDVDDTRTARYGVYYTKKKPLTTAALEQLPGI